MPSGGWKMEDRKGGMVMKKEKLRQNQSADLQLVSIAHAAQKLDVSTRTVHRYIEDGALPALVMGGKMYRIRETVLQEFIETLEGRRLPKTRRSPEQLDLGLSEPVGEEEDV